MKRTTKSCSTYLSAKRLQRGHWVNLTSPPLPEAAFFASPAGARGAFGDFGVDELARLGVEALWAEMGGGGGLRLWRT